MTLRGVFRRAARAEFDAAAMWYEDRQPGLGTEFVAEIDHPVELASSHPDRFSVKHGNIRCVQARRFPYSVFFRPEADRLVAFAVFHARHDPDVWQTRA